LQRAYEEKGANIGQKMIYKDTVIKVNNEVKMRKKRPAKLKGKEIDVKLMFGL